jgi:hypothetical protein
MATTLTQIFSYTFVFLLGVILGAAGELLWNRRPGNEPINNTTAPIQPQIPILQINNEIPSPDQPVNAAPASLMDAPIQVVSPIPVPITPVKPAQPVKPPSKEDAKKAQKALSIVEQVDEILQELQKFSRGSGDNVSLLDDGHNGVIVKVGSQSFPGIDAVTIPDAQTLIRQAVTEWERRSARG